MNRIVGLFKGPNIVHDYEFHFCLKFQRKGPATPNTLIMSFETDIITNCLLGLLAISLILGRAFRLLGVGLGLSA